MKLNNPAAEALAGPIEELGNQADLWREQQATLTRRERVGRGLEIDLGFAGTGDAPEQEFPTGYRAQDCPHRSGLGLGEYRPRADPARGGLGEEVGLALGSMDQTPLLQSLQHGAAEATVSAELPQGHGPGLELQMGQ